MPSESLKSKLCSVWPVFSFVTQIYQDGMADGVDPEQTDEAVWSGSAQFANTYLARSRENDIEMMMYWH